MNRRLCIAITFALGAVILAVPSFAWKFASIADSRGTTNGVNVTEFRKIIDRINLENVDFVIFQGDAVTGSSVDSTLSSQFDNWLTEINRLNCPWYYTPGNHEIASASQEAIIVSKISMPTNGPAGYTETVYSFDYSNAHFVALNSDHAGQQHHVQRSWLATDLAQTYQPHVFVYAHDPAYPAGPHVGSSLDLYPTERDEFWRMLSSEGVKTYFCGHEHLYQRTQQGSVTQVINGTCGAPLATAANAISAYQYIIVDVNGSTVTGTAKYDDGSLMDSWSYTVPDWQTCDQAKLKSNTQSVWLRNVTVTCVSGSDCWVEEPNRSAGFRATVATGIAAGDIVNVRGTLETMPSGERRVNGTVIKLNSGNPLPEALGMNMKALLGGPRGYSDGATGGTGQNNSGLRARVFGRATISGSGYFYLDDGSGLIDGSDPANNIGVRVNSASAVTPGQYYTVTGVVSTVKNGTTTSPAIQATEVN